MTRELKISDLVFSYFSKSGLGETKVIDDFNLSISENKITVLMGPSGCGKTTLLNLIAGVLEPDSGKIVFTKNGTNTKPNVGYVFQTPSLIPWRTVKDNVLLGAEIRELLNDEVEERANRLLMSYGLEDFMNAYPSSLSGGMQQRVSIIRAVVSGADVLLLDEPFANTDFILRKELQEDLLQIVTEQNLIAIMVTHDLFEAVKLADDIIVLNHRPMTINKVFKIEVHRNDRMETNLIMKKDLINHIESINRVLVNIDNTRKMRNA